MGFDQYHEPPDELPAATRTFARLCASLTEEAEAIGWYEQRLAVETDAEAAAIMRDAQGEEFKHFSMDLEFLLRRTPLWREIAQGILFQGGDIVAHGEAAEESAVEGAADRGEPLAGTESLGHRPREGGGIVSHLLREHAPITATGWDRIDQEARERLTPALAARKLIDFAGPHGWQHSATNLGRTQRVTKPPADGLTAVQRQVLPLAELRALICGLTQRARGRRPRRRGHRLRRTGRGRACAGRRREHGGLPRLEGGRDRRDRTGVAPRRGCAG